jgi:hypothetical protein
MKPCSVGRTGALEESIDEGRVCLLHG